MVETFLGIPVLSKGPRERVRKTKFTRDFHDGLQQSYNKTVESISLWNAIKGTGSGPGITVKNPIYKELPSKQYDVSIRIGIQNILTHTVSEDNVAGLMNAIKDKIASIDTKNPNLDDEHVKAIYEAIKSSRAPKVLKDKNGNYKSDKRLATKDDGGESWWSDKVHTWIKGYKKTNGEWISPVEYDIDAISDQPNKVA